MFVLVYADDILGTSFDSAFLQSFIRDLDAAFALKLLVQWVTFYVLKLTDSTGLYLTQSKCMLLTFWLKLVWRIVNLVLHLLQLVLNLLIGVISFLILPYIEKLLVLFSIWPEQEWNKLNNWESLLDFPLYSSMEYIYKKSSTISPKKQEQIWMRLRR